MLNEIRKTVGLLALIVGCNLFIGCENSVLAPSIETEPEELISFDMRLPVDENGYYHMTIDTNSWQTLHRVSASVNNTDGVPIEFFWVEWESDLYWYLGDTLGYVVNQHLTDSGNYVSVDTSFMIGFNGQEVPTSNTVSYSNSSGELNNMIAPVRSMIGDTLQLTAIWYNSEKTFGIVLE